LIEGEQLLAAESEAWRGAGSADPTDKMVFDPIAPEAIS